MWSQYATKIFRRKRAGTGAVGCLIVLNLASFVQLTHLVAFASNSPDATSKSKEVQGVAGSKAGETKADESSTAPAKKDEAKKDEAKKDEAKKDEAKKDEAKKDAPPTVPVQNFTPVPRWIVLPKLELEAVEEPLAILPWNPRDHRFHLIVAIASWNPKSIEVVQFLNSHKQELQSKRVLTVGVFLHDTLEAVKAFVRVARPNFPVGIATGKFLAELKQSQVPTFWILNTFGEIVVRKEIPGEAEQNDLIDKLRMWTNF